MLRVGALTGVAVDIVCSRTWHLIVAHRAFRAIYTGDGWIWQAHGSCVCCRRNAAMCQMVQIVLAAGGHPPLDCRCSS